MASEDIFETYSDEIIAELHQENENNIGDEHEVEEETENITEGAVLEEETTETIQTVTNGTTEESAMGKSHKKDKKSSSKKKRKHKKEHKHKRPKPPKEDAQDVGDFAIPLDISSQPAQVNDRESRLFQLPMTRVRNLMKLDPDLHIASHEAAFVVTRATELFIESLARESYIYTAQAKKKTVQKRDVDMAIAAVDSLMFLEGAMNF